MRTISDELLRIARRCAEKLTVSSRGTLPALEDLDEDCADGIEEMLSILQDDEVFGEVDLNAQQKLVDQIEAELPEDRRALMSQLAEQHMRHVWLQQEAAYHLGLAVGMKFAKEVAAAGLDEDEDEEEEEEDEFDDEDDSR